MKRQRDLITPSGGPYTCCPGPRFSCAFNITTQTMVALIEALSLRFGEGYEFRPEPITEGGIQMTMWPGKDNVRAFKTIRFILPHGTWPEITADTWSQWQEDHYDEVIWRAAKGNTYLKAFHGAPCWTQESVTLIMDALISLGFKCIRSSLPKKKDLMQIGYLGEIL